MSVTTLDGGNLDQDVALQFPKSTTSTAMPSSVADKSKKGKSGGFQSLGIFYFLLHFLSSLCLLHSFLF